MSKLSDWLVQPIIEEDITKNSKIKRALKRLIDKNLLPKSYSANVQKLQTFLNTNQAIAGVSGRDISQDRSLKALQEKAKREMSTEVGRARVQELATLGKLSSAQQIAGERGRNRARAFRYQAFGSLLGGAMKAAPLMGSAPTASITQQSSLGPTRFSTFNTGIYS